MYISKTSASLAHQLSAIDTFQMISEMDSLRAENVSLRSEVNCFRTDKKEILDMMRSLRNNNKSLVTKVEEDGKKHVDQMNVLAEKQKGYVK